MYLCVKDISGTKKMSKTDCTKKPRGNPGARTAEHFSITNKDTTINQLCLCARNVVLSKYKAPIFALSLECISFVEYKSYTYYNTPVPWRRAQKVSDFLFKTIHAICQLYHGENKLHFDDDDSKHLNTV